MSHPSPLPLAELLPLSSSASPPPSSSSSSLTISYSHPSHVQDPQQRHRQRKHCNAPFHALSRAHTHTYTRARCAGAGFLTPLGQNRVRRRRESENERVGIVANPAKQKRRRGERERQEVVNASVVAVQSAAPMKEARYPTTDTCATAEMSSSTRVMKVTPTRCEPDSRTSSLPLPAVLHGVTNESDGVGASCCSAPPLSLGLQRRVLTEEGSPDRTTAAASNTPEATVGVQRPSNSPRLSGPSSYSSLRQQPAAAAAVSPNSSHSESLTHQMRKEPSVQQLSWSTNHGCTSGTSGGAATTAAGSLPSVVAVGTLPSGSELLPTSESNVHKRTPLSATNLASVSSPLSLAPRGRMDASMGSGDNTNNGRPDACGLFGTSRARLATTRRQCGTTVGPRPPPHIVLHATERGSRIDQSTMTATTKCSAPATAAPGSGRRHEDVLSVNCGADMQPSATTPCWASSLHDILASSLATTAVATVTHVATPSRNDTSGADTASGARKQRSVSRVSPAQHAARDALAHILQRERVRALISRALSLWRLYHALRLHERRHSGDDSAEIAVRETPLPTPSVDQPDRGEPTSVATTARHAFSRSPHADAAALMPPDVLVHPHPLSSDHKWKSPTAPEGVLGTTAESKEAPSASTSLPMWTPLGGIGTVARCCGISTDADDEDGLRDLDDGVETSRHVDLRQRQQQRHHRDRRCAEGSSRLSDAAPSVDGGLVMDAASLVSSMVPPLSAKQSPSRSPQSLHQAPVLEEVFSASRSACAAPLAEAVAAPTGSRSDASTTTTTTATEWKKSVVQHLLASRSPHHSSSTFLAGGVGSSAPTLSPEGSFSRPHSNSQSTISGGATVLQGGPLLHPHRPRSGAGLIASDLEDRSSSSLVHTPQGRRTSVAGHLSGVEGSPRGCDSARSRSMTPLPMPLLAVTTVSQLLAREAEDRLALQAREEQRRSRLQRDMSAVMDQLMMAALHHRSSEPGLHPSLRTSAVASPIPQESDDTSDDNFADDELRGDNDGRGIGLRCTCAMEAQSGSTVWGSAEAIASAAWSSQLSAASPPPAPIVTTPWSARRRLNHNANVMGAHPYRQRSRLTEAESRWNDATEDRGWGSLSCDDDEDEDVGMSAGLRERTMHTLGSTRQWGTHVLDAIIITTDAESNTSQATSIELTSPSTLPLRSSFRLKHTSRSQEKRM